MGKHRVLQLFALIWILACGGNAASSATAGTSTDGTDVTTTPGVPTSTQSGIPTTAPECDWEFLNNVTGSIWVTWFGYNETDKVEIQTTNMNQKPDCQFNSNLTLVTVAEDPAELEVCPNENYMISINCSGNNRTFLTLPGPPSTISFREIKNTSFEAEWEKPSGSGEIIEYKVQVFEASENIPILAGAQNCTVQNLRPYTDYTVHVSARNSNDSWGDFVEGHVMTTVGIPHAPPNLTPVNITNTTVILEWEEPTPTTGPVLIYMIEGTSSNTVITRETPDNATRFMFSSLAPFTYYTFKVLAVTEVGLGPLSNETEAVQTEIGVPHAPANLMPVSITNTTVTLDWEEPTPSTGPVLIYMIEARSSNNKVIKGNTTDNATRFEFSSLAPFTNYIFKVLAVTEAGLGPWSNETEVQTDIGVPHPPANLDYGEITNTSVMLTWEAPKPSTGPLTEYTVLWNNDKSHELIYTNSTEVTCNVTGLLPYMNYTFQVAASTTAGRGKWSSTIVVGTDIGIPHSPTHLSQSGITNTSVLLTWKEPEPSTGPITTYAVYWKGGKSSGEIDINSTNVNYNVTGLLPYVNYTFKVAASTDAGTGSWSETFEAQTSIGVPHPPTDLNRSAITNTSVLLTWKEPKPSTGPITTYMVYWKGGKSSGEIDINSMNVNYNVTGLLPYVNYTFKVGASTDAGTGRWSEALEVQTSIGVPYSPTYLSQNAITNTSVLLTWREPEPSTGPITTYIVYWKGAKSSGEIDINSTNVNYNVTGLLPYVNYTFKVAASTKASTGFWSESIRIQTEVGVPTAPMNLRFQNSTDVSLIIKWDRPTFPNAPELNYTLLWRVYSEINSKEKEVIIPDKTVKEVNTYEIRGLLPYSNYSIRVFASTYVGIGPPSNQLEAETEVGVPQPAVILEVKTGPNRTALVRWETPGDYPGPVSYSLQAWKLPGPCSSRTGDYVAEELRGFKSAEEWHSEQTTQVPGLSPYGNYSFLIVLKTSATNGVESKKSDSIRIPPEESSEPLRVLAECINSPTQLNVSWGPPSASNGVIEYYNIEYGIEDQWMTKKVPIRDMCQNQSSILTGLRPERRYGISVRAHVKGVRRGGKSARPEKICMLPAGVPYLGNTSRLFAENVGPDSLVIEWTNYTFSDYMGALVRYTVLVGRLESLGNTTSGKSANIEPPWSNFTSGASDFYQVTPSEWNPFLDGSDPLKCEIVEGEISITVLRCFIGIQKHCLKNETYCNGPLDPDTPYEMKIRAFTRGGFTETDLLYARSGVLPGKSSTGTVVAIVISLFILLSIVGGGYVLRRKGYIQLFRENIISKFRPEEEPPSRPLCVVQMKMAVASKPVKTEDFKEHVRIMMADCKLRFSAEFEELSQMSPKHPCDIAGTDENRPKNRYANIYPFDHSRVKLLPLSDEPGSDYINANYIPGYLSPREYIATQGPLPHTVDDFWRMVWEQSTHMIVMLTSLVERGKTKCEQYWPDSGETQYFNDLIVTCVSESMLSSYTIRIFHVQSGSKERHVKQMHYTNWPDFGSPECPENFISFVSAVRDHLPRTAPGPIVVHCSAGVGRTGTFIAIDRLLRQLLNLNAQELVDEFIDIFGLVLELRNHRTNMVQAEDQYVYIHFCVQHLIQSNPASQSFNNEEHIYSNVGLERDTQM